MFSLMNIFLIFFIILNSFAFSQEIKPHNVKSPREEIGKCGDDLAFSFDEEDGSLHIFGNGEMYNFLFRNGWLNTSWSQFQDDITSVFVTSGVTSIGNYAFYECLNLTSVTIDSNLTSIGKYAFCRCPNLISLDYLGTTVPEYFNTTFSNTESLEYICLTNDYPLSASFCGRNDSCRAETCEKLDIEHGYYNESSGECKGKVVCSSLVGWKETVKNCTEEIISDPFTPSGINKDTISCYDVKCSENDVCSYMTRDQCDKVCDEKKLLECKSNVCSSPKRYTGCEAILQHEMWEAMCTYEEINDLLSQEDQCYEVSCENDEWIIKKRENATKWEQKTNGCVKYFCDNRSGGLSWSLCNNTKEVAMICVDGNCVQEEQVGEHGWSIELEIGGLDVNEMDINDILNIISNSTGIEANNLNIATEANEEGRVVRVFIILNDETSATTVMNTVSDCSGDSLNSNNVNCPSFLKQVKVLRIIPKNPNSLDVSKTTKTEKRENIMIFILITTIISFLLPML